MHAVEVHYKCISGVWSAFIQGESAPTNHGYEVTSYFWLPSLNSVFVPRRAVDIGAPNRCESEEGIRSSHGDRWGT